MTKRAISLLLGGLLVLMGCGDDSGPIRPGLANVDSDAPEEPEDSGGSKTAGIDVCALLTDAELSAVLGSAPPAEAGEPAGPFTNCSWGIGRVLVSIATSDNLILAPGEDECPSAEIGEVSHSCPGRVMFLTNGIHVSVTTIENVTNDQLWPWRARSRPSCRPERPAPSRPVAIDPTRSCRGCWSATP